MAASSTSQDIIDLMRWMGWAQRKAGEEVFRARDLTLEQGLALGHVLRQPGAIQRDIARLTGRGVSSVSSLLQGLERRGLLERRSEAGDDRSKRLYLTAAGRELISGLDAAMADVDASLLAPLDADERGTLQALMDKLTAPLGIPGRP